MSADHKPIVAMPAMYASLIPLLVGIARANGYALGVHGSMARDLDLIAAPWSEDASSAEDLIEAMRAGLGGWITQDGTSAGRWDPEKGEFVECIVRTPGVKPHGRLAWNIHLGGRAFLDVSVMPRSPAR